MGVPATWETKSTIEDGLWRVRGGPCLLCCSFSFWFSLRFSLGQRLVDGECWGLLSLLLVSTLLVHRSPAVPNSNGKERKEKRQGPDTRASVLCQLSLTHSLSLSLSLCVSLPLSLALSLARSLSLPRAECPCAQMKVNKGGTK